MRKLFAIGTLLLSSAAVMVSPAAASDRNIYVNNQNHNQVYTAPAPVNNQNFGRGYSAPAPVVASYIDRGRLDREAEARLERKQREERLERERRERALHDARYFHSFWDRY